MTRELHLSLARPPALVVDHVELRPAEYSALFAGHRAHLTIREFETLYLLAQRRDCVLARPEIYAAVWGGTMPHRDRSVDVYVRKVRSKLAVASPGWTYVHTHFGVGYRFEPVASVPDLV